MIFGPSQLTALDLWLGSCNSTCRLSRNEQAAFQKLGLPVERQCMDAHILLLHCHHKRPNSKVHGGYHFNCIYNSTMKHMWMQRLSLWFVPCTVKQADSAMWRQCLPHPRSVKRQGAIY